MNLNVIVVVDFPFMFEERRRQAVEFCCCATFTFPVLVVAIFFWCKRLAQIFFNQRRGKQRETSLG